MKGGKKLFEFLILFPFISSAVFQMISNFKYSIYVKTKIT